MSSPPTHHRFVEIDGHRTFYREAGPADAPIVVLLHGYPTSSFMFRDLIPLLAEHFHVIAPDHLGFGLSAAPAVDEFDYSFDSLAAHTSRLLSQLGVESYAIYVQDYGAPLGWRLALQPQSEVWAIVSQNGNAYEEGFVPEFWQSVWDYTERPGPDTEAALRPALGVDAIRWQYLHGVQDPTLVSPDTWHHDAALVGRPGNDLVQLRLFADYVSNVRLYPAFHDYLRRSRVPVLAVWGRNDEIFAPAGAEAFRTDALDPEIHLLDGGHFLLESALDEVSDVMTQFLRRVRPRGGPHHTAPASVPQTS